MNNQENVEKAMSLFNLYADKMWEFCLVSLGSISWSQQQTEKIIEKYLEQRKNVREETTQIFEDLFKQAHSNQIEIRKLFEDALVNSFNNFGIPKYSKID